MDSLLRYVGRRSLQTSTARFKTRIVGPSGSTDHAGGTRFKTYRNIAVFIFFPVIILLATSAYLEKQQKGKRPPFVKYEYLRRRTKRFPWGDGNKSLFHNPYSDALPDGYETEEEEDQETTTE